MLTKDGNQINMALTVQKVISDYYEVWSAHNSFSNEVGILSDKLKLIQEYLQQAALQTEGITKDKANAAEDAIEKGIALAGSAYVYAKKVNNETLKKQFDVPLRALKAVQGVVALTRLKELYANLLAIIDQLGNYVTPVELEAFEEAVRNFENRLVEPRKAIVNRAEGNDMIAQSIKELKSIMENLDMLVTKFADTEFERSYRLARIVIDLGSRKRKDNAEEMSNE